MSAGHLKDFNWHDELTYGKQHFDTNFYSV